MFNSLYENIGEKIKTLAKWIFIVEAISAIIAGVVLLFADEDLIIYGLFIMICGPIIAWVSSWILYALGELVADTHAIRQRMYLSPEEKEMQDTERKVSRENEIMAQQQALEKIQREKEEQKKREAEEKAKRDTIEKAKKAALQGNFNTLIPMDKPAKFTCNESLAKQIQALPIDELYNNYLSEDDWTDEYRYMCYLELKKRLG